MNLSFLVLSWALSFGYLPSQTNTIGYGSCAVESFTQKDTLKQTIELGLTAFNLVKIWTNIETYDSPESVTRYIPFRSDYNIGLNVGHDVGNFRLDAGIEHECIHPVLTVGEFGRWNAGGHTEIYVKVSGSIGGER